MLLIVITFLFVYSAAHTILVDHKLHDSLTNICQIYHDEHYFRWMDTLKCVSLALSVKDSQDRAIINHMEFIAEIMFQTVFEECSNVLRNDSNVVNNDEEYSKRYSLTKYFIKDLENVHLKDR